ncbi:DUF3027 domain-containing protein [Microbacterium sp. H1-D42]|uniref:DUF3027 domain-containing protein n=1 Tax=Microbacterium sp. H1-D42 TaxID=2925844 RepID=UPI001F53172C|nr:DUF3027 domain-containing protein [Microbacterium sp. H1-D42]UNK71809.1 DUF3027 domain-containing protein [Microbacterium sp. H1-D42]
MTSTPDEFASATRELALAALHEITPAATVGPAAGHTVESSGAVSLRFENRLPGYPGWYWTVSVAQVDDAEPTVLEVELMPGDGALLAPDWVPWTERLAEYRAHQAELAAQGESDAEAEDAEAESDDLDDVDDLDAADFDEDGSRHLHGGDLDGVDIDELDENDDEPQADDESDDEDESDDDDESDDEDESDDDDESGEPEESDESEESDEDE